ncbi:MAG: hypothetical protein E7315_00865 [Clostridiales bacterium]|nr:hypothetical protein [Clostridiales bacterium]
MFNFIANMILSTATPTPSGVFSKFVETLSYMWKGMLGVFVVIVLVILGVYLMLAMFRKKKK